MMNRANRPNKVFTPILIAALLVAGCGYRLVDSDRVLGVHRVHVAPVIEDGVDIGLGRRLHRDLTASLARQGVATTMQAADAELVLRGTIARLAVRPGAATFGADSAPSYYLNAQVTLRAEDVDGRSVWTSGPISVSEVLLAGRGLGTSQLDILATEANRRRALDNVSARVTREVLRRISLAELLPSGGR